MLKVCSKCGEEFLATTEYFYARKDSKDGLRSDCRECSMKRIHKYVLDNTEKVKETHKISCSKYRLNNKEKISEQNKLYNIKNKDKRKKYCLENKEHIAKKVKQYTENHKEHLMGIWRLYAENNKEMLAEKQKKWAQENRDKCNITHQRYIAKKLLLPYTLTFEEWEQTKLYFDSKCCYCGEKLPLVREHFIPVDSNGGYVKSNIIPSCKACNTSKLNKDFFKWYPKYKFYSKEREDKILEYLELNKDERLTSAI